MERNLYKLKPSTYKILKHLNQEITETEDIFCPLHEDLSLNTTRNCGLIQSRNEKHEDPAYMIRKHCHWMN